MKLKDPEFRPFPPAAITPQGWLARQLRIQADGLSGHLDEFWPDIHDSAWIGGKAEGWERMPYWLDGVIPLAWLIDDEALKHRIKAYLDYIIEHQNEDGWLGPRIEDKKEAADLWSQALALKMLVVYHDASGDDRIPACIEKALRMLDRHIDAIPLDRWGLFRWFEFLISIWWLYARSSESWLLDLATKLQAQGFSWQTFFRHWPLTEPTEKGRWNFAGHVVNNAMALKAGALCWRLNGREEDLAAADDMLAKLDAAHGMVTGVFSGDECLAGKSPSQGTELCAVCEYMYSLECLISISGQASFADRLEKITFNALPATFSPDMWSHQYDQQVNQIECSVRPKRPWTTNGDDSNIFGLEPNYGCCTANLSQGWPKFAAHQWMRTSDDGIAAVAYAPSRLTTTVAGASVDIDLKTNYPFRENLDFTVTTEQAVEFSLYLRIPEWAEAATLDIDGKVSKLSAPGTFHEIKRVWKETTPLRLALPMPIRIEQRPNNAISLLRGPLVYALKVGEEWRQINQDHPLRDLPHADWEVYPTTPWNYALAINRSTGTDRIDVTEQPIGDYPFSPEHAPVALAVKARRTNEWVAEHGSAASPPTAPSAFDAQEETVLLIPYGCTHLRIAEFPVVPESETAS